MLPAPPDRDEIPGPPWVMPRFSPDGNRLFALYDVGNAVRWELEPDAWRRHACLVAGGFTRDEWAEAVPDFDFRATCASGGSQ